MPIWLELMKAASEGRPVLEFEPPPEVSVRKIDRLTGLLAPATVLLPDGTSGPPDPKSVMDEVFVIGTEPVEVAQPAAVANPDLLLDLYDEEAEEFDGLSGDSPRDSGPSAAEDRDEPLVPRDSVNAPHELPVHKQRTTPAVGGLPSLDDEL